MGHEHAALRDKIFYNVAILKNEINGPEISELVLNCFKYSNSNSQISKKFRWSQENIGLWRGPTKKNVVSGVAKELIL